MPTDLISSVEAPAGRLIPMALAAAEVGGYADNSCGPICIVDDDEAVCDALATALETYGFSVLPFTSAIEFLADKRRHQAICLIIDQHMPQMDGLTTVATLRGEGPLPPTILISGRSNANIWRRAAELGVQAILDKPFRAAQLVALIRTAATEPGASRGVDRSPDSSPVGEKRCSAS